MSRPPITIRSFHLTSRLLSAEYTPPIQRTPLWATGPGGILRAIAPIAPGRRRSVFAIAVAKSILTTNGARRSEEFCGSAACPAIVGSGPGYLSQTLVVGSQSGEGPALTRFPSACPEETNGDSDPGRPHVFAPKWQTPASLPGLAIRKRPVRWPFLALFVGPLYTRQSDEGLAPLARGPYARTSKGRQ
jgi:hypothetical protein